MDSNNKRIAKNTLMLYIRLLLSIIVGLYTSRVVLQTLGVEDYGIYGVVGGVVLMFSFLNATMSGATSRFLTFEMGKGNVEKLRDTFSSALIVHIIIALIVFVLAETLGLWFVCNKLVIPEDRYVAALYVYQFSILGSIIGIVQVPFNADIIANEEMDVYAYVELMHVFLKLGIVYLLLIGNFDKLILYAVLVLVVHCIVALTYGIYCTRHYLESRFRFVWNKDILIGLTSFSGYNLLGNFGSVFNLQGINFLINIFFGVTLNAACSIATTVSGIINGFVANIVVAFRPPITKAYAGDNISNVESLLCLALKTAIIIHTFFVIPLLIEMDTVLQVWLGTVPDYASIFCRIILISIYFETIRFILVIGIHAVGKVKNMSLVTGTCYIINPFVLYVLFKLDFGPKITYFGNIALNLVLIVWVLNLLHDYIPQLNIKKLVYSTLPSFGVAFFVFLLMYLLSTYFEPSFYRVLFITCLSTLLVAFLCYIFCLDSVQRIKVNKIVKNRLHLHG